MANAFGHLGGCCTFGHRWRRIRRSKPISHKPFIFSGSRAILGMFVPLFAQSFAKKTRPVLLLQKIRLRRCGWFGQWTVGLRLNGSMAETGPQGDGIEAGAVGGWEVSVDNVGRP